MDLPPAAWTQRSRSGHGAHQGRAGRQVARAGRDRVEGRPRTSLGSRPALRGQTGRGLAGPRRPRAVAGSLTGRGQRPGQHPLVHRLRPPSPQTATGRRHEPPAGPGTGSTSSPRSRRSRHRRPSPPSSPNPLGSAATSPRPRSGHESHTTTPAPSPTVGSTAGRTGARTGARNPRRIPSRGRAGPTAHRTSPPSPDARGTTPSPATTPDPQPGRAHPPPRPTTPLIIPWQARPTRPIRAVPPDFLLAHLGPVLNTAPVRRDNRAAQPRLPAATARLRRVRAETCHVGPGHTGRKTRDSTAGME